jgi:hypothetical protein
MVMVRRMLILAWLIALAVLAVALPALAQDGGVGMPESAVPVFNLAWVAAVIGFFLPLVISFVKRRQWSDKAKRLTAFVISAVAGVVNVGVQAGWVFDTVGQFLGMAAFSIIDVYVAATVIYQSFWKDTAPEAALAAVGSNEEE